MLCMIMAFEDIHSMQACLSQGLVSITDLTLAHICSCLSFPLGYVWCLLMITYHSTNKC